MNNSTFRRSPIFIIGILFFIFGFITWLNSALVPFLRLACELNNFESYLVTFAFYIAYFVFAIPSAKIIAKRGYRQSMSIGLWVMALGALCFVPAALFSGYLPLFLAGLFLLGAGLTLLQTASNPYVAFLGPPESAAKRISIMGVCNKTAGMLAPILLSALVLSNADAISEQVSLTTIDPLQKEILLNELAEECIIPYLCISLCLFLLSVFVRRSSLPEITFDTSDTPDTPATSGTSTTSATPAADKFNIFKYPALSGGIVAIFFYVGAEVISIDTLMSYAEYHKISLMSAKWFPSLSMFMLLLGYFIGIWGIPKHFSQKQALVASCLLGIVLSFGTIFISSWHGLLLLSLLGLANAMIWPSVWGMAMQGLGEHTNLGSSLLIMAILGGALLPLCYGWIADSIGLRQAYIILPFCYSIIIMYGLLCFKQNKINKF